MGEVVPLRPPKKFRVTVNREAVQLVSFTVEAADKEAAEAMVDTAMREGKVWSMPDIGIDFHSCDCDRCQTAWECFSVEAGRRS